MRLQLRDVTWRGLEKLLEMGLLGKSPNFLGLPLFSSSKREIILPFLLYLMNVNLLHWKHSYVLKCKRQDTPVTQE